jgi:hypothetical protein
VAAFVVLELLPPSLELAALVTRREEPLHERDRSFAVASASGQSVGGDREQVRCPLAAIDDRTCAEEHLCNFEDWSVA